MIRCNSKLNFARPMQAEAPYYYKADDEPFYYKLCHKTDMHKGAKMDFHSDSGVVFQADGTIAIRVGSGIVFRADGNLTVEGNIIKKSSLAECKPYLPSHPRDVSLNNCVDDDKNFCLAFSAKLRFPSDYKSLSEGQSVVSDEFPLYHDFVLWGYALRITREKGNTFSLSMESLGQQVGGTGNTGFSSLSLPELADPRIIEADLLPWLKEEKNKSTKFTMRYSLDGRSFCVDKKFTQEELRLFEDDAGQLNFSLRLIVPRSYFSLSSLIDLNAKSTVSASTQHIVRRILEGKTPRGSDMQITGCNEKGRECCKNAAPSTYFVHKSAFAKCQFASQLEPPHKGQKIIASLKGLCDHEIKMMILVAYGGETSLPLDRGHQLFMIGMLWRIFGVDFIKDVAPQWEREICSKVLAMDRSNPSSSMVELLHLLDLIWSSHEGGFPVAKRIAIGVLADMAHLNARSSLQQWVIDSILPHIEESGCDNENVCGILSAFHKMMKMVPAVEKTIVSLLVAEWPSGMT